MSTRANIIVQDQWDSIQLYRHGDGYPDSEHGVIATLPKALKYAWPLPRMEASDFAAAIVRAWKKAGGNIYIDGSANRANLIQAPPLHGDIEYLYIITPDEVKDRWAVEVHDICFGYHKGRDTLKKDQFLWKGYIGDKYPERG